jgi:hypothetical protein
MKDITATQAREFSKLMLDKALRELIYVEGRMAALIVRWDERNAISKTLRELGGDIFELDKEKSLPEKTRALIVKMRNEWHERFKVDRAVGKKIKGAFNVGTLFNFYKSLPTEKKRYFNEMNDPDIKKRYANLIMANSFHHHMFFKDTSDVMKWLGFTYNRGWHYNGINYGS